MVVEGEQQVLGELREDTGGGELDAGGDGVDSAQRIAAFVVLDGFSIAVTTGHGSPVMAWDTLDPSQATPNELTVFAP